MSTAAAEPVPNPRPRDAATLILLRSDGDGPRVLMGQRTTRDAWSRLYVFPGGTVDAGDHRIPSATDLRPEVASRLELACGPARARALAVAAVRETFEETGFLLGRPEGSAAFPPGADPTWAAFSERSLAPDLGCLHFLCRAITPPRRPRRFNARFFIAEAGPMEQDHAGSGELHDLRWFGLDEIRELPLPLITQAVLDVLEARLADGGLGTPERTPLFRTIRDRHLRLFE